MSAQPAPIADVLPMPSPAPASAPAPAPAPVTVSVGGFTLTKRDAVILCAVVLVLGVVVYAATRESSAGAE
jgi:hypothetical protein